MYAIHEIYDGDVTSFLFQSKLTTLKFISNNKNYYFKKSLRIHQFNHRKFGNILGENILYTSQSIKIYKYSSISDQRTTTTTYTVAAKIERPPL